MAGCRQQEADDGRDSRPIDDPAHGSQVPLLFIVI